MNEQPKPLCTDLDGTLIKGDVTRKAAGIFAKRSFLNIFRMFFWLLRGRARFKQKLAESVDPDAASFEYNGVFLEFIRQKKKEGRRIFLATAANRIHAQKLADYLGIFDGVLASTNIVNLRAEAKARALIMLFGENGFAYAGNSEDDVKVWDKTDECILVSPSKAALKKMQNKKYLLFEQEKP
ncbi:MAG: hypothetical protein LBO73_02815 [Holosporaceae bacterium]|jgi:phosphoserine phosphatase|nr:hypothetical protein [Holosporaceae bacterium]